MSEVLSDPDVLLLVLHHVDDLFAAARCCKAWAEAVHAASHELWRAKCLKRVHGIASALPPARDWRTFFIRRWCRKAAHSSDIGHKAFLENTYLLVEFYVPRTASTNLALRFSDARFGGNRQQTVVALTH